MKKIKKYIFDFLKENLEFSVFSKLWTLYQNIFCEEKNFYQAHFVSMKGEKKYFIVRMTFPLLGIGAAMRNFILVASWAEKRGWIPVLDWEYGSTYLAGRIGQDNLQDYLFENQQSIKEILKNNEVLVGTINHVDVYDKKSKFIYDNMQSAYCMPDSTYEKEYFSCFSYYLSRYFPIKRQLITECEELYKNILQNRKETIAVMLREEFSKEGKKYVEGTPREKILKKHPTTLSTIEMVELVKQQMKRWNCTYIFVSTIMQETKEIFEREFGDKVQMIDRHRQTWEGYKLNNEIKSNSEEEKKKFSKEAQIEQTKTYLQEIYIASKCGYIVGVPSTGTTLALSMNGGEYISKLIVQDENKIQQIVK